MNSERAKVAATAAGRTAVRGYGRLTAQWRPDPEFLIIGTKRGGTTSFYYDLLAHPQVCPLFPRPDHLPKAQPTKGIHYFDANYLRGSAWFRSHLPSTFVRQRHSARARGPVVTGEASPYYLFHPAAADRAAHLLPDTRLIAVLRDPIMRTYSHWKERRRNQLEELDFADALAAEDDRLGDADERLRADPHFVSYAHEHQSYARQSEYASSLEAWYAHYPADHILVLASEDYYREPQASLDRALNFLGLPSHPIASGEVRNAAAGNDLDRAVRAQLSARFAPHNAKLTTITGETFPWE